MDKECKFEDLVTARKCWINEVLKTWCQQARCVELRKAEVEWLDIAGKVSPDKTLWPWAWSRFPELIHENLGIEETSEVCVELRDGRSFQGFPDARKSQQGNLILWGQATESDRPMTMGPFSIDDITAIRKIVV